MPQGNQQNSLRALLGLRTPSHVQTGDPWMARRQSEIASGVDEWIPDADSPEYKYEQMEQGARTGVSLPRADARSADMSRLRQVLGLAQRKHEQELEQEHLKGQYGVAGQVAGQEAAMDRLIASQGGMDRRAEGNQETQRAIADLRADTSAEREAEAAANRMELERYRRTTPQATANQQGGLFAMLRRLLGMDSEQVEAEAPAASAATPQRRILSVR